MSKKSPKLNILKPIEVAQELGTVAFCAVDETLHAHQLLATQLVEELVSMVRLMGWWLHAKLYQMVEGRQCHWTRGHPAEWSDAPHLAHVGV